MPWCPVCKNEYREGIERCAECKVTLVDSLEEETASGEQERKAEREKLARLQAMIAAQEQGQQEDDEEEAAQSNSWHPYQNSAAKAEDNRSSWLHAAFCRHCGICCGAADLFRGDSALPERQHYKISCVRRYGSDVCSFHRIRCRVHAQLQDPAREGESPRTLCSEN